LPKSWYCVSKWHGSCPLTWPTCLNITLFYVRFKVQYSFHLAWRITERTAYFATLLFHQILEWILSWRLRFTGIWRRVTPLTVPDVSRLLSHIPGSKRPRNGPCFFETSATDDPVMGRHISDERK
jgi:hypothetical protein